MAPRGPVPIRIIPRLSDSFNPSLSAGTMDFANGAIGTIITSFDC